MAHNNGSTVKRGILRPGAGGSRIPFFIIVVLSVFCVILLYNVYSGAANKSELEEEVNVMRVKNHMCSKDRIDTEKKYELLSKTMKQKSESDSQKIKSLQSSNAELNDQLKTLNSQLVELRDSKTSVDEQISQIQESKMKLNDTLTETLNELKALRVAAEEKAKAEETKISQKNDNVAEDEQKQQRHKSIGDNGESKVGLKSPTLTENKPVISKEAAANDEIERKQTTPMFKPRRKQPLAEQQQDADANFDQPPKFNVQAKEAVEMKPAPDSATQENSLVATELPSQQIVDTVVGARKKNRKTKVAGRRNKTATVVGESLDSTNAPIEPEVIGKKKSKTLTVVALPPGPPSTVDNESNVENANDSHAKSHLSQKDKDDAKANEMDASPTSEPGIAVQTASGETSHKKSDIPGRKVDNLQSSLPEKLSAEKHKAQAPDDETPPSAVADNDDKSEAKKFPAKPAQQSDDDDAVVAPPPHKRPAVGNLKLKTSNDNKAKEDYRYQENEDEDQPAADAGKADAVAKGNRNNEDV